MAQSKIVKIGLSLWIIGILLEVVLLFLVGRFLFNSQDMFNLSSAQIWGILIGAAILSGIYLYFQLTKLAFGGAFLRGNVKELKLSLWVLGLASAFALVMLIIKKNVDWLVYFGAIIILLILYYLRYKEVK